VMAAIAQSAEPKAKQVLGGAEKSTEIIVIGSRSEGQCVVSWEIVYRTIVSEKMSRPALCSQCGRRRLLILLVGIFVR
jgi:hypothetical protein